MNEHNLVPNIRFKGFDDEWTNKKFINFLAKIIDFRGKTPKKLGLSWSNNGKYRALSAINVKNGFIDKNIDVHFGNYDLYKKWMGNTELEKGDILFTTEAPMGNIAIINDNDKYILSQRTIAFRVNAKNINGSFLLYRLNTVSTKNKLMRLSTGGTAQGISQKNLSYLIISVSNSIKEQQKIGDFFSKLDKLLDLQQQKINKLELLKKSLLQKLFPKHDAKIPELRFKGFEDEWKKEKLSKLGHTFSGLSGKTKKDFGHGKAKYITYMNVFKNPLTSKTGLDNIEVDSKQHNVKYGDVLFTMSSETPEEVGMSSVWKYHLENIYLNSFSFGYRLSTKFDLNFLAFMFRSQLVRKEIKILAQGISRYNISKNKMMDIVAYFPTDSEQQKIGNLLSKVDQLIELENKKLQNLQQVKKCLLQNMFVE